MLPIGLHGLAHWSSTGALIKGGLRCPQKYIWRAEIVLLSAAGLDMVEITRRTGTSKT